MKMMYSGTWLEKPWKLRLVFILQGISAIVSIIGSGLIVYSARKKLATVKSLERTMRMYLRFMVCISTSDMFSSAVFIVCSFMMPSDDADYPDNHPFIQLKLKVFRSGNNFTCNLSAFLRITFGLTTLLYNLSLNLYFLLTVSSKKKKGVSLTIERLLHAVPLAWGLTAGTVGWALGMYGPRTLMCYTHYKQSPGKHKLSLFLLFVPSFFICCFILLSGAVMVWKVRVSENKGRSGRFDSVQDSFQSSLRSSLRSSVTAFYTSGRLGVSKGNATHQSEPEESILEFANASMNFAPDPTESETAHEDTIKEVPNESIMEMDDQPGALAPNLCEIEEDSTNLEKEAECKHDLDEERVEQEIKPSSKSKVSPRESKANPRKKVAKNPYTKEVAIQVGYYSLALMNIWIPIGVRLFK